MQECLDSCVDGIQCCLGFLCCLCVSGPVMLSVLPLDLCAVLAQAQLHNAFALVPGDCGGRQQQLSDWLTTSTMPIGRNTPCNVLWGLCNAYMCMSAQSIHIFHYAHCTATALQCSLHMLYMAGNSRAEHAVIGFIFIAAAFNDGRGDRIGAPLSACQHIRARFSA